MYEYYVDNVLKKNLRLLTHISLSHSIEFKTAISHFRKFSIFTPPNPTFNTAISIW